MSKLKKYAAGVGNWFKGTYEWAKSKFDDGSDRIKIDIRLGDSRLRIDSKVGAEGFVTSDITDVASDLVQEFQAVSNSSFEGEDEAECCGEDCQGTCSDDTEGELVITAPELEEPPLEVTEVVPGGEEEADAAPADEKKDA